MPKSVCPNIGGVSLDMRAATYENFSFHLLDKTADSHLRRKGHKQVNMVTRHMASDYLD